MDARDWPEKPLAMSCTIRAWNLLLQDVMKATGLDGFKGGLETRRGEEASQGLLAMTAPVGPP